MLFASSSAHRLHSSCIRVGAKWTNVSGLSPLARIANFKARTHRPTGAIARTLTTTRPSHLATPAGRTNGRRGLSAGIIGASTLVVVVVVGGVAYARYVDPSLRDRLEKNDDGLLSPLPAAFSGWLLDLVFGNKDTTSIQRIEKPTEKSQQQPLATDKEKAIQSGLLHKKLAREAAVAKEKTEPESVVAAAKIVTPTAEKVAIQTAPLKASEPSPAVTPVKKEADEKSVAHRIIVSDASVVAENEALTRRVKESVRDLESIVSATITVHGKAVDCIRTDSKETTATVTAAEARALETRAALQRIRDVLQEGRKSKRTAANPALIDAEVASDGALYRLQKAENEIAMALSEAKVMKAYKKEADESRRDESNILNEGDVGLEVDRLRRLIATQQKDEQVRIEKALQEQRQEYERLTGGRLTVELQRQQRELEIEYHKKVASLSDEYEQELLQQLRRQTAAHTDHLHDVMRAQQSQLAAEYGRRLEDHVTVARHQFQVELAGSLGRLRGIDEGLKVRAESDEATCRSRRLWVACQALRRSMIGGQAAGGNSTSWEAQRKPLSDEMAAVRRAAGDGDPFVAVVLNSVPEKALSDGVFTETALKSRFARVTDACSRVALIGADGGSLFRYFVSYLQSLALIERVRGGSSSYAEEDELADRPSIDVDGLSTHDILQRARRSLDSGNLQLALCYMNQLKGAPRVVARDWIVETRLFLEVSQAADALLARAAASEVRSVAQ